MKAVKNNKELIKVYMKFVVTRSNIRKKSEKKFEKHGEWKCVEKADETSTKQARVAGDVKVVKQPMDVVESFGVLS